ASQLAEAAFNGGELQLGRVRLDQCLERLGLRGGAHRLVSQNPATCVCCSASLAAASSSSARWRAHEGRRSTNASGCGVSPSWLNSVTRTSSRLPPPTRPPRPGPAAASISQKPFIVPPPR